MQENAATKCKSIETEEKSCFGFRMTNEVLYAHHLYVATVNCNSTKVNEKKYQGGQLVSNPLLFTFEPSRCN